MLRFSPSLMCRKARTVTDRPSLLTVYRQLAMQSWAKMEKLGNSVWPRGSPRFSRRRGIVTAFVLSWKQDSMKKINDRELENFMYFKRSRIYEWKWKSWEIKYCPHNSKELMTTQKFLMLLKLFNYWSKPLSRSFNFFLFKTYYWGNRILETQFAGTSLLFLGPWVRLLAVK